MYMCAHGAFTNQILYLQGQGYLVTRLKTANKLYNDPNSSHY